MKVRQLGRVLIWDIETSSLNADMGIIICASVKATNEDYITTFRIDKSKNYTNDTTDDRQLCVELRNELSTADATVAHYGSRFDLRFLNTRLLIHGESPLPPINLIDTWRIMRDKLKMSRNSLLNLQHQFNLEHEKTPLPYQDIVKAVAGQKPAIDKMVKHCEADVLALEEGYERLIPVIQNHPYVGPVVLDPEHSQCPVCSSSKTQCRGARRTKRQIIERKQCQNCGKWFDGKAHKADGRQREIIK